MNTRNNVNPAHSGVLLAHDLLEHQNGLAQIGTIDDELEALGGIWFVRGQHNDLNRDGTGSYYTVHENIASDVTRMFVDVLQGSDINMSIQRTLASEAEVDFEEILRVSEKSWKLEMEGDDNKFQTYEKIALARMRIGYRKAKRRFKNINANALFWKIANVTPKPEYEGQQFKLTYDNNQAFCEEYYDHRL